MINKINAELGDSWFMNQASSKHNNQYQIFLQIVPTVLTGGMSERGTDLEYCYFLMLQRLKGKYL